MGPNTYYVTKYEAADDNASIEGSLRWALTKAKNDATTATPAHIAFDEALRENCAGTVVPLAGVAVLSSDKGRLTMMLTTIDEATGVALTMGH